MNSSSSLPERLSLDTLSPDILSLVLRQLGSPREVFSAIRVCSILYNVFQLDKTRILANAVQRSFHPAVLPIALVICDVKKDPTLIAHFEDDMLSEDHYLDDLNMSDYSLWWNQDEVKYEFLRGTIIDTAEKLLKDSGFAKSKFQDLDGVTLPLCRLWKLVDIFIKDYSKQALAQLRGEGSECWSADEPSEETSGLDNIDEDEYGRLQRAFVWFELWRRLFGGYDDYKWRKRRHWEHCAFQISMSPIEIAELWSVYEYLIDRMDYVLETVDRYLIFRFLERECAEQWLKEDEKFQLRIRNCFILAKPRVST